MIIQLYLQVEQRLREVHGQNVALMHMPSTYKLSQVYPYIQTLKLMVNCSGKLHIREKHLYVHVCTSVSRCPSLRTTCRVHVKHMNLSSMDTLSNQWYLWYILISECPGFTRGTLVGYRKYGSLFVTNIDHYSWRSGNGECTDQVGRYERSIWYLQERRHIHCISTRTKEGFVEQRKGKQLMPNTYMVALSPNIININY